KLTRGGYRPKQKENLFGAWAWKCSIKNSASQGKLSGKKIAIKDNVAVAGIPLTDGSSLLKDFIPTVDATIISRIIDAGGEIAGKSVCENLCVSSGSHTSYPSPVKNPRNPAFMAGGSSSGSAALLATGEVDMAIGGDQAGSIRMPAAWCGVLGLKPTHGLVPYSGILGMDPYIDHVGPMANSSEDLALLLEVIAGRDGMDPRQLNTPFELPRYSESLGKGIKELRIGIVNEGFGWENLSEKDVDEMVREKGFALEKSGATVSEISIPEHRDAVHIWSGIALEGAWYHMIRANGLEHQWAGEFDLALLERWSKAFKAFGNKLPETAKLVSVVANYMAEKYSGRYYGLARNLRQWLIKIYDEALASVDILLMPTTPQKPPPFEKNMSLKRSLEISMGNFQNTCAFDVSGHPALSVPCGTLAGLPVGMMLVGRYFEESTLLRVSAYLEKMNENVPVN
ncbi:MAG TPA: amidase, partial [Nitrososphaerales archaeon]|nr:amidase [Nitrososphaerales archaeon]